MLTDMMRYHINVTDEEPAHFRQPHPNWNPVLPKPSRTNAPDPRTGLVLKRKCTKCKTRKHPRMFGLIKGTKILRSLCKDCERHRATD